MSTIALRRTFLHEIPETIRPQVLRAITTTPLTHNSWFTSDGKKGCVEVVAAFAAVNERIDKERLRAYGEDTKQALARMQGISVDSVRDCIYEWDHMSDAQRADFIYEMKHVLNGTQPSRWELLRGMFCQHWVPLTASIAVTLSFVF